MAGKSLNPRNPLGFPLTTTSVILIFTISIITITFFYLFSYTHPLNPNFSSSLHIQNPIKPECSFVTSLEHFLKTRPSLPISSDSIDEDRIEEAARRLDDRAWEKESRVFYEGSVDPSVIRVYVYEMPAKFTYDLLWLFMNTYRETSNLTSNGSPVHRLIEQVLKKLLEMDKSQEERKGSKSVVTQSSCSTMEEYQQEQQIIPYVDSPIDYDLSELFDSNMHSVDYWLWADLIAPESKRLLKNVIRVHHQEEADLFYIPLFTTIGFFLLEKQQCKALYREALKWVTSQPAWQRSEGRDHILPVHHPWSFKSVRRFMKKAIWLLPDMDSTGNWYKPGEVWLEKDLILPYVPNVDACDANCISESEPQRKTLLFFRGRLKRNAGGKIRGKLVEELHGIEGVVIEEGTSGDEGKAAAQDGMRKSIFCLSPAGDTPSSARLFDAIVSGCIPVIISDELELPFEGILDYRKIALFVSSSDALQPGWLITFLRSINTRKIRELRSDLSKFSRHFLYSSPSQPLGPEDLAWRMIAGKLVNIKLHIRRSQRMVKESRSLCTCECKHANITTQT